MIRRSEPTAAWRPPPSPAASAPWDEPGVLAGLAFATLWASGPDPASDRPFRLRALRHTAAGWEEHDEACAAPDVAEAGPRFAAFLAGRPVLVAERQAFLAWLERVAPSGARPARVLDLVGLASLFTPGRLASHGERLTATLCPEREDLAARPLALAPHDLATALRRLVARVQASDVATLAVLAHGFRTAHGALRTSRPDAADALATALALIEHPSAARPPEQGLVAAGDGVHDGLLGEALRVYDTLEDALDAAQPRWGVTAREERRGETLAALASEEIVLDAADRRIVDEIFQEHLPRRGSAGPMLSYREGQHAVAARIAATFGQHELFLVHAPTGTGKTLAYLVPAILWAFRNGVRVGVATYTRALQEQALDRDVPIALEMLARAGMSGRPLVTLLKGRRNYLCWRAFKLQTPLGRETAEELVAWTTLALFALREDDGDLDRFPRRSPADGLAPDAWTAALERLLRTSAAEVGCCAHSADRDACGAEAARRRSERAHVVITNHAFALARRELFRHVVFDECEHLHDVAHNAFSTAVPLRALRELLLRLYKPGGGRLPLNRVAGLTIPGSESWACARSCIDEREGALAALERLQDALQTYKLWREDVAERREEQDLHSLFREFVNEHECEELLTAHAALRGRLNGLHAGLAQLSEHLDSLDARAVHRIRRALDVARAELEERFVAVDAWIPRGEDGAPWFRPETFYDLESDPTGDDVLAARVLLPHEYLGSRYYPDLAGAVFISATTWLRGGFDAQATFLGLTRALQPRANEERDPCFLHTFRAPETFDYGRVLVAVPRDAPSVREGKVAFLDYVARFIGHVAERTRGRLLALFTNASDVRSVGTQLAPFFAERRLPFWYQRMDGTAKEELSELFRACTDSVLLGLDTFWYGADFPGATLEYLVVVRLPYGVPDRYHHAQSAALGPAEQRRQIYMPRALAKLRQGFGRLMRKETDRGCVFFLDGRILDPRHSAFLKELPVAATRDEEGLARFVSGDTDRCVAEALAHMQLAAEVARRGLEGRFRDQGTRLRPAPSPRAPEERLDIPEEDLPY